MSYGIVHHVTSEETTLVECLKKHFRLSLDQALTLIEMGAVYSDHKRLESDRKLPKKAYLKVHLHPRRFPVETVDWAKTIVVEENDFLIINKPSTIPVHATTDNTVDNVLHQLRKHLNRNLWVTQRLDIPVSGLMVVAKTADFQRQFNDLLSEGKVEKRYLALVGAPPPLGLHVHFMDPAEKSPRKVSDKEKPDWLRCELKVHTVKEVGKLFEVEVELITGRTHQIRTQLAALGSPIVGDRLYGSRIRKLEKGKESIPLASVFLSWKDLSGKSHQFSATPLWKGICLTEDSAI